MIPYLPGAGVLGFAPLPPLLLATIVAIDARLRAGGGSAQAQVLPARAGAYGDLIGSCHRAVADIQVDLSQNEDNPCAICFDERSSFVRI